MAINGGLSSQVVSSKLTITRLVRDKEAKDNQISALNSRLRGLESRIRHLENERYNITETSANEYKQYPDDLLAKYDGSLSLTRAHLITSNWLRKASSSLENVEYEIISIIAMYCNSFEFQFDNYHSKYTVVSENGTRVMTTEKGKLLSFLSFSLSNARKKHRRGDVHRNGNGKPWMQRIKRWVLRMERA